VPENSELGLPGGDIKSDITALIARYQEARACPSAFPAIRSSGFTEDRCFSHKLKSVTGYCCFALPGTGRLSRHGTRTLLATTTSLNVFAGAAGMIALLTASHTLIATMLHLAA
jgi:hypothetical protein